VPLFRRKYLVPVEAEQVTGNAMITLRSGRVKAQSGDWIVTEGERQFVVSDQDFQATFEPWRKIRARRPE
jgi:hypothetical protein